MTAYAAVVWMRSEAGHALLYAGDDAGKAVRAAWIGRLHGGWDFAEVQRWEDGTRVRSVDVPLQVTQPEVTP